MAGASSSLLVGARVSGFERFWRCFSGFGTESIGFWFLRRSLCFGDRPRRPVRGIVRPPDLTLPLGSRVAPDPKLSGRSCSYLVDSMTAIGL